MNFIKKIDDIVSKISIHFVRILFIIIVLGMLVVNSVYLYSSDTPAFRWNNVLNYLGIVINLILLLLLICFAKFLEKKWNKKYTNLVLLIFYFVAEIVFLLLVPIQLFSDMLQVVRVAFSNFTEGMEYLRTVPNNLAIVLIFQLIGKITTNNVWALKILNCVCNVVTLYFTERLYQNVYGKKNSLILVLGIFLIPTFLYVNMVYNDILSTMLSVICLYLITKEETKKYEKVAIPILLFLQFIIRPIGIILIIASVMYYILKKKNIKMVVGILTTFVIMDFGYQMLENKLVPETEEVKPYPIWSFIQIGLNEEKFGFQDGSFSSDWTSRDIVDRIKDLGPARLIKLLAKKEYWLWTEGTYQTERYAFGVGMENQFYYDTFFTKQLYDAEDSDFRNGLEYVMKGQYLCLIALALIASWKKDEETVEHKKYLFYYTIVGIFCFYLIWEIKSRYIFCLYPIFLIMATNGIQQIIEQINLRKDEKNGKV